MRLFFIPLLAALVGVPTLSPSLPAAEADTPPKAEGAGEQRVKLGDDQTQRTEAQRKHDETLRLSATGKPATDGDRKTTQNNSDAMQARIQERVARLKTDRPELFNRLDLNSNGELSTEELRRPRELYTQRHQTQVDAGDQDGRTDRADRLTGLTSPAPAKGAARSMPQASASDENVGDYIFGE